MSRSKKGAMEISVGAIVILILAITFLSLALVFMKGMLGKMFMRFDEQITQEPEPAKPSLSYPITLSRNPIITKQEEAEAVKISIFNPSKRDWIKRQFIRSEGLCGKVDGICYIDVGDTTGTCDTESNAKKNDDDCKAGLFTGMDCGENGGKSPCLISNTEGGMYCPNFNEQSRDPDCRAKEGVEVYLSCDERVMEKPFKREIGSILTGEYKTNILLLRLRSRIPDDQYLCQIRIFAEDKEYVEDLVIRVENE